MAWRGSAPTPEALAEKRQGDVVVNLIVGEDGLPQKLRIEQGLGLGLAEKAIEAIMKWRFLPGLDSGRPSAVEATVEVPFRIAEPTTVEVGR